MKLTITSEGNKHMFTYNKLRNIWHITLKQNMQMRSRGEKTGYKAKQTTHSLQTSGTFSTEQELECPHPRTQKKTETHAHCKQKDMYKPTHFVLLALGPGSSLCGLVLCCVEFFSCKHTWNELVFTCYCSKQSQIHVPGGPLVQRPCRLLDMGQNQLLCLAHRVIQRPWEWPSSGHC